MAGGATSKGSVVAPRRRETGWGYNGWGIMSTIMVVVVAKAQRSLAERTEQNGRRGLAPGRA